MIKSLLLTLSCVIGSGSGALQKNAPIFNNEIPQKNAIYKETNTDTYVDTFSFTTMAKKDSSNYNYYTELFKNNTIQMGRYQPTGESTYRVAKKYDSGQIGNTQYSQIQVSKTGNAHINGKYHLWTDNTYIISIKNDYIPKHAQQITTAIYGNNYDYNILPNLMDFKNDGDNVYEELYIYACNFLPNPNVMEGTQYQTRYWQSNLLNGQYDERIKTGFEQTNLTKVFYGDYEAYRNNNATEIDQTEEYNGQIIQGGATYYTIQPNNYFKLSKNSTDLPTELPTYTGWNTYIYAFHAEAEYNDALNLDQQHMDYRKQYQTWTSYTTNITIQSWKIYDPNNPEAIININYETVPLASLFWQVLTMPFTFIATAFNFTLFEGTAYAVNPASILLALLSALVIAWILKKLITRN